MWYLLKEKNCDPVKYMQIFIIYVCMCTVYKEMTIYVNSYENI